MIPCAPVPLVTGGGDAASALWAEAVRRTLLGGEVEAISAIALQGCTTCHVIKQDITRHWLIPLSSLQSNGWPVTGYNCYGVGGVSVAASSEAAASAAAFTFAPMASTRAWSESTKA